MLPQSSWQRFTLHPNQRRAWDIDCKLWLSAATMLHRPVVVNHSMVVDSEAQVVRVGHDGWIINVMHAIINRLIHHGLCSFSPFPLVAAKLRLGRNLSFLLFDGAPNNQAMASRGKLNVKKIRSRLMEDQMLKVSWDFFHLSLCIPPTLDWTLNCIWRTWPFLPLSSLIALIWTLSIGYGRVACQKFQARLQECLLLKDSPRCCGIFLSLPFLFFYIWFFFPRVIVTLLELFPFKQSHSPLLGCFASTLLGTLIDEIA